jgi:hypothetical protein
MAKGKIPLPKKEIPEELIWIERATGILDSKFKIPGTSITFGIDPILGLIPGVGEIVSFGISGLLVISMVRHGASREVAFKMLGNLGIDLVSGTIPLFGDIFDVYYKANRRNYHLLKSHYVEGKHQGKGWRLLIGVTIVILLMFSLLIFSLVKVWQFLWHLIA